MNRFPKSGIKKILGYDVRIIMVDELDKGNSLGECQSDKNMIRIVSKQSRHGKIETLVHEQLEFINDKSALQLDHNTIDRLTTGIMSIVGGNK